MGAKLYTSFGSGGSGSYGVHCGGELSDQEWNRMLAERDNVVVDESGKVWRDPGVGNTKLGDKSPFRAAELDAQLAAIKAEKEARKRATAEKRKARTDAEKAAKAAKSCSGAGAGAGTTAGATAHKSSGADVDGSDDRG